jgi:hypothetical protein
MSRTVIHIAPADSAQARVYIRASWAKYSVSGARPTQAATSALSPLSRPGGAISRPSRAASAVKTSAKHSAGNRNAKTLSPNSQRVSLTVKK